MEQTLREFGRLDGLVNNAGINDRVGLEHGSPEDFVGSLGRNLLHYYNMAHYGVAALKRSGGCIVNIASTEGLGATPGDSPYAVAKTGVIGLTRALAVDLGPEGITVNCICPGPIRTPLTGAIPEEHKTIFAKRRTALKRYGYPEEVAHMTFSLCLPAASYITGAIIPVDGGLMIRNA